MTAFGLMGVSLSGTPDDESAYVSWQNAVLPNPPYTGVQTRRVYYPGIPSGAYDNQIQICIDKGYKACVSFNPTLSGARTSNNLPSLSQMQTDQNAMVAYLNTIVAAFTTAGMTPISKYLAVTMAHEPTNPSSPANCTAAQFQNIYATPASGGQSNYTAMHAICPVWIDLLGNTQGAAGATSYFPAGSCDGYAVDYYGGNYIKGINLTTFSNVADANSLPFSIWETGNTAGTNFPTSVQMEEYLSFLASFFGSRITNSLPIGEIMWFQANGSSPGYNIISSPTDYRVPYLQALNVVLNPSAPPPPPPPPPSILPGPGGPVTITYGPASALDALLAASNTAQGSAWPSGLQAQNVALSQLIGTALMPNPDTIPSTLLLQGSPPLQLPSGTAGWVLTSDASGNITLQAPGSGTQTWTNLLTPVEKNASYTAAPGDLVMVDTTGTSPTVTLPTAPPDKTLIGVLMYKQPGTNTVTVAAGGSDTFDGTASVSRTIKLLLQGSVWQYNATLASWVTWANTLSLTQLDARYVQGTTPAVPKSFTPANPASTVSNSVPVMMGLGAAGGGQACVYTPAGTGHVEVKITGSAQVATTGSTDLTCGARYGTGTAPANGAANTGTSFGTGSADLTLRPTQAATFCAPFSIQQTITVTPGTQIWVDLSVQAPSGTNAALVGNLVVSFTELPT